MSFKVIKELRQAGKLEEALLMAEQALEAQPDNIWNKRASAWVYYEFLKKYAKPEFYDGFKENLCKIKDISLNDDEKMVFDNCAWQIIHLVLALHKEPHIDHNKINNLFDIIKEFHFTKPSEVYSRLYKAFHKDYENWSGYLEFADWWNFENFRAEDFLEEEFNGRKIMALAEQAFIAYAKKLLEGQAIDSTGYNRVVDKDKITSFLPKLDKLIDKHPNYQYPPFFKAKLLLATGDNGNVLSAFLPFAKQKRNDFWVWQLMAEIFSQDQDIKFACYCKALSLKAPEDFLIKLHQTFAGLLIEKQMFPEAKLEIQKVVSIRTKHEWKIPNQVILWQGQEWYKNAIATKDNIELYLKHVKIADELLFQDLAEEVIVVEFVNENKNMLNFVKNKDKFGFFNYSDHLENPEVGDKLKVRFNGNGQDGFYKVFTVKKAEPGIRSNATKEFKGQLKILTPHNIGFVEDVFIEPQLIAKGTFSDGQNIFGTAILSFNKKKNQWGWKAIGIQS